MLAADETAENASTAHSMTAREQRSVHDWPTAERIHVTADVGGAAAGTSATSAMKFGQKNSPPSAGPDLMSARNFTTPTSDGGIQ